MHRFLVSLALLSVSHIALAANLRLGPEVPVGNPLLAAPPDGQTIRSAASNGRDYLVLWNDGRQPIPISNVPSGGLSVTRVDVAGHPIDPLGHRLVNTDLGALVSTGTTYVLVYTDLKSGHTLLQLLDGDGNPAGSPTVTIVSGHLIAAASNGRNIALISELASGRAMSVIDLGGMLIRSNALPSPADQIFVLPNGDYGVIAGGLLIVDGTSGEVAQHPLPDLFNSAAGAVASSDSRILVSWIRQDLTAPAAYFELIDASGNVIVPATALATADVDHYHPAAGWDGHEFLVTFRSANQLAAFRVSASGQLIDKSPIYLGPRPFNVAQFAGNAGGTLLAWSGIDVQTTDVFDRGAGSFDDLVAASTNVVAQSAVRQQLPRLASGGTAYTTWREGNDAENISGAFVGSTPSQIAPPQASQYLGAGAVARAGDAYLVVWREPTEGGGFRLLAKRVGLDGKPIDTTPIVIVADNENFSYFFSNDDYAVGSDGTDFLVVWDDHPGLKGVRVSPAGAILDAQPIEIQHNHHGLWQVTPRVAWTGSRYVVAWYDTQWIPTLISPPFPPQAMLRVAGVGADGQVLDSSDTPSIGDICNGGEVALAATNGGALLIFSASSVSVPSQRGAFALPLHADGTPAGSARQLQPTASSFVNPDVTWNGKEYVAVWGDPSASQINALRFDASGTPIDDAPFAVNPAGTKAAQPAVAASAAGATIAYVLLTDDSIARLFARTLDRSGGIGRMRVVR